MNLSRPLSLLASLVLVTAPAAAQDLAISIFTTVETENVVDFEQAAIGHSAWHASQNDAQAWPVYQAMTGRFFEYAFVAPNMTWSQLDNPTVDMAEDQMHWIETATEYTETEEMQLWQQLADVSNPLPGDQVANYPVVRVIEFEILQGGDGAAANGMRMFHEAMSSQAPNAYYAWNRVVSGDHPPRMFIAVWAPTFEALGTPGPTPLQRISDHFGPEVASMASGAFNESVRTMADRIWMFRPDLSYLPGT